MNKIVALDIETPNRHNDRICSIGLTVIMDGEITETIYYLINPETEFDQMNIAIHGIHPIDVHQAPTFPEVWNQISELVCSDIVVAHNATFDLGVLRKTLQAYEINESIVQYACTLEIAKKTISDVDNYRLPTLCSFAGIDLEHHNAESDSIGCAKLLCLLLNSEIQFSDFTKTYDLAFPTKPTTHHTKCLTQEHQALNSLKDIISAITCDNILNEEEIYYLQNWLNTNLGLKGHYPYDQIFKLISTALSDGVLEQHELELMLELFKQINNPVSSLRQECQLLVVTDKTIVLTGEFDRGDRNTLENELALMGATCKKTVTKHTSYVIVGGQGSTAWSAENYGNKVKKALELQDKGAPIQIIRESDFYAALRRE